MTKEEALKKAGYVPKLGRPTKFGEMTETITIRIPVTIMKAIPEPKVVWIRNLIAKELEKRK